MSLQLTSVQVEGKLLAVHFILSHSQGSGRDGTTLEEPLVVRYDPNQSPDKKAACEIQVMDCYAETPDLVLTKMSSWLRRLADGLDQRNPGAVITLPFGS